MSEESTWPSTKAEAKKIGAKFYYTGKPCKRGHIELRYSDGACIICKKENTAKTAPKWRDANRSYWSDYMKSYRENNKERISKQRKEYRKENKEKLAEYNRWHMENFYDVHVRKNLKRRATLRNAYYPMDEELMELVVSELEEKRQHMQELTGVPYDIDHIVPLTSDYVCGLHCPFNLQVIPKSENIDKGNRWWPDM